MFEINPLGNPQSLDCFDPDNSNDVKLLKSCMSVIRKTIQKIDLNLTNLTILTEAASGYWIFLPIIAAMANSQQVICYTKTTKYGTSQQIMKNLNAISKYLGIEKNIVVYEKLDKSIIQKADVVTNSGHLRPIKANFLKYLKKTAVITLMWEPWEFRETDLDLKFCLQNNISILGTNEHNSEINAMSYAGNLLEKIFSLNKITVKNKKIILIGENISATYLYQKLISLKANVYCISTNCKKDFERLNAKIISNKITDPKIDNFIKKSDMIIIATIPKTYKIIGGKNGLSVRKLKKLNSNIKILVYHGNVDYTQLQKMNFVCYPKNEPPSGHMGWTADLLGPKVTIETLALGLKTGEILGNLRKSGISSRKAELEAIKTPFCLDFPYSLRKKLRKKNEN